MPTGNITDPLSLNYYAYCSNNPIFYQDPSGHWVETALDVVSLIESTASLAADPSIQNALFFAWDAASVALPFIPGSYLAKGVKWISKTDDVIDIAGDTKKIGKTVLEAVSESKKVGTITGTLGIEQVDSWQAAEKSLRELIGDTSKGNKARTFQTNANKRIWDAYNPLTKTAAESKYGYASLSKFIQSEIDRDIYLRNMEVVDNIEWHFYVSNVTGKGGPSEALKNKLIENRINIVLH